MTQPDAKPGGSWLDRLRGRIRGHRADDTEPRTKRRGNRMDARRIEDAKKQDKHDPMSGVGGSW